MCPHQRTLCSTVIPKCCPVPAEVYSLAVFANPFHGLHSKVSTTSDLNKYLEQYLGNVILCGRTSVCFSYCVVGFFFLNIPLVLWKYQHLIKLISNTCARIELAFCPFHCQLTSVRDNGLVFHFDCLLSCRVLCM